MSSIRFFPLNTHYKTINDLTHTYIFARTLEGKPIFLVDNLSRPSFYIIPEDDTAINNITIRVRCLKIQRRGQLSKVVGTELADMTYHGKQVTAIKVKLNRPEALATIQEGLRTIPDIKKILEVDIPYRNKYWIDRGMTPLTLIKAECEPANEHSKIPVFRIKSMKQDEGSMKTPNILAISIKTVELDENKAFANNSAVVAISFHTQAKIKTITWKRFTTSDKTIEFVNGESELIERAKNYIDEQMPDFIVGYNSDSFTIPHLIRRAKLYRTRLDISADHSRPYFYEGNRDEIEMTGPLHLDITKMATLLEIEENENLEDLARKVLKEKPLNVRHDEITKKWEMHSDGTDQLCRYGEKDAELTYRIAKELMPKFTELIKLVGQPPQLIIRMNKSQLVEYYLMKRAKESYKIIPNKREHDTLDRWVGYKPKEHTIFDAKPGLYKHLHLFDLRSIYPAIIISHNISPETEKCECCEENPRDIPYLNTWFCRRIKGEIPEVLNDLVTRELRVRAILKSMDEKTKSLTARRDALRMLANAFHYHLRSAGSRWNSKGCEEAITAYGQKYINQIILKAKVAGLETVHSESDTLFLKTESDDTLKAKKFEEDQNYQLPEPMEIIHSDYYRTGLFVPEKDIHGSTKRRYALLKGSTLLKIKGFENSRSNISRIAREVQDKVIWILLKEENPQKALEYVKSNLKALEERTLPVESVIITSLLTKRPDEYEVIAPHVAAAKLLESRGQDIVSGNTIQYVIKEGEGRIRDRVRLPTDPGAKNYDPEYYKHHQVIPAIERILEAFGYTRYDITGEKPQNSLKGYFNRLPPKIVKTNEI